MPWAARTYLRGGNSWTSGEAGKELFQRWIILWLSLMGVPSISDGRISQVRCGASRRVWRGWYL